MRLRLFVPCSRRCCGVPQGTWQMQRRPSTRVGRQGRPRKGASCAPPGDDTGGEKTTASRVVMVVGTCVLHHVSCVPGRMRRTLSDCPPSPLAFPRENGLASEMHAYFAASSRIHVGTWCWRNWKIGACSHTGIVRPPDSRFPLLLITLSPSVS